MVELDKKNFEAEVQNYTEKPVFVDFWSDGCEACKELMPGVHELAEKYGDKIKFASLNIKGARRLAISQKVMGLPAMIIYKNGEILDRMSPEDVDEDIQNIENFITKTYNSL
ncbi:MAG: thiol reductase thioredoxin [Candidatus Cloacimonadota bacterium]|nr:MAG: thiol reductase thioredoxin [Candidatus Cloacimonadota bacterium]